MEDELEKLERTNDAEAGFFERTASTPLVKWVGSGMLVLLGASFDYGYSRVADYFWEPEPPAELVRLNQDLASTSVKLESASSRLTEILAQLRSSSSNDPVLNERLDQLKELLEGFSGFLEDASATTARAAANSQLVIDDLDRMKVLSDGSIDGMPNLLLSVGDGVNLCDGEISFGVTRFSGRNPTNVVTKINGNTREFEAGERRDFGRSKEGHVDYMGRQDSIAKFKVNCASNS